MKKSEGQIRVETTHYYFYPKPEKRRITKDDDSGHKVGDIVIVKWWGTFGCWDEENRWVDFYYSESV